MRRCNIQPTSCHHRYSPPCCKDCRETDCESRCQNDPVRCHCWTDKPPKQRRGRRTTLDRAEIFRLYEQGLSQRDIAARLGYSKSGVNVVLHEEGGGRRAEP